jgi:hypothetical protein
LEGRTPKRARFGGLVLGFLEFRLVVPLPEQCFRPNGLRRWSWMAQPPRRLVPVGGSRRRVHVRTNLWIRAGSAHVARPGNGRRGEAPRGAPRFGGSKALKGEPQGRCEADGLRQAQQGANRRGGSQTSRAEGAVARKPRVDRICCSTYGPTAYAVGTWCSGPLAQAVESRLESVVGDEIPGEPSGANRETGEASGGTRHERLQGRAKRRTADRACTSTGGTGGREDPKADATAKGMHGTR